MPRISLPDAQDFREYFSPDFDAIVDYPEARVTRFLGEAYIQYKLGKEGLFNLAAHYIVLDKVETKDAITTAGTIVRKTVGPVTEQYSNSQSSSSGQSKGSNIAAYFGRTNYGRRYQEIKTSQTSFSMRVLP